MSIYKHLRFLNENEKEQLKRTLLEIYADIKKVCDKHGLTCMLNNGCCLGALLWKGFIPWDDDMDICLTRRDYEKLLSVFQKELGDKYEISSPAGEQESQATFTKICKKNTSYLELPVTCAPFPKGIFIDVAALDFVPKNKFIRKIKGMIIYWLTVTSTSMLYYLYPDPLYEQKIFKNSYIKFKYKVRVLFGWFVSLFISRKNLIKFIDKFMQHKKDTGILTEASSLGYYYQKSLPTEDYFPPKEVEFEGIKVNIMRNPEKFFKQVYGKIEKFPPEEKRREHPIVDIKF